MVIVKVTLIVKVGNHLSKVGLLKLVNKSVIVKAMMNRIVVVMDWWMVTKIKLVMYGGIKILWTCFRKIVMISGNVILRKVKVVIHWKS